MLNNIAKSRYPDKATTYFWIFITLHILLWTIGPSLLRPSVPHDTLEGITWGLEWQLGYYKHPFLTAWFCAGITKLFGTVGWPVYLLAQLAVATTFIAVWALAKKILPSLHALLAALMIEGILFYNINSFNITPDTMQSPFWALLTLVFFQALTTQKIRFWFYTGILAAICICIKYQVLLLLIPMFLLCIIHPVGRISFKNKGIYIGILTMLLVLLPHLIWLYLHDLVTMTYAQNVSADYTPDKTFLSHLKYPLRFIVNEMIHCSGLFILLWPFYKTPKSPIKIAHFEWSFLLFMGLGPFILTVILCIWTGNYFPTRWATPYFFLLGIISLAYLKPVINKKNLIQFTATFIFMSSLLFLGRMSSFTLFKRAESDAFLPNQQIAHTLSKLWQDRFNTNIPYLAGSNYLVSSVTPYLGSSTRAYLNWEIQQSPWINEDSLRKNGGIFIWDAGYNYIWDKDSAHFAALPQTILTRFPQLIMMPPYTFRRSSNHSPILIGVALLPPK